MPARRKACGTCVLAKTQCIWEGGSRCERCLRLNKVCAWDVDEEVLSHRREAKKRKRPAQDVTSPAKAPEQLQTPINSPLSTLDEHKYDIWLTRYRNQMIQRFPFVPVQPHVTAAELQAEKPQLFNAIMMASCDEPEEQVSRAMQLRRDLAEKIMVNGESSIDILQAILVAAAWYHVHLDINYQITNLLALGTAMLVDLQLNVNPHQEDRRRTRLATYDAPALHYPKGERTLEERRIFLGFQYMCTFVFVVFKRVDLARNEFYGEQCCQILELTKQYATDNYLTYLYRLAKHAQTFALVLDVDSDNLFLKHSLSTSEQGIVQMMKTDFETFRDFQTTSGALVFPPASAHIKLVELYFYELLHQIQCHGKAYEKTSYVNDDPGRRCRKLAFDLIEITLRLISGPPSSWTWFEVWHSTHSILVLLKTVDEHNSHAMTSPDGSCDANNNVDDQAIIQALQNVEEALAEGSKKNSTSVSSDHNIYLRKAKQIRTLRERFCAQRSIDLALLASSGPPE